VLAAPDGCPESWNVEKMLDYEKQWQKSFLEPVAAILSAAKWNVEKQNVLPF
jgi:hypothetical protein